MMGKIDKVSRITGVKLDPNSPWLQRRRRDGQGNEGSFQDMLKNSKRPMPQKLRRLPGRAMELLSPCFMKRV